jgi:hypothetical protein
MEDHAASVRNLLELVPRPPEAAIPGGLADEDIDAFQSELGYTVPPPLREWLRVSNGPCVGPGGLFGIGAVPKHLSIQHHLSLYPEWGAKKWLPVAGDGCGNYYLLVAAHDFGAGFPVVFVEPMVDVSSPIYVAASGLWSFLDFILRKELAKSSWPFGRAEVVAQDPGILDVTGVPLPWDA